MAKRKVILDVDTGSDDAVALCAAALSPDIELVAACSVWGNRPIENTTDNTLRLFDALGIDVPVYRGCDTAMTKFLCKDYVEFDSQRLRPKSIRDGKEIRMHGAHLPLAPTNRKPEDIPAVCFYVDYLRKSKEKVTLIPVGPPYQCWYGAAHCTGHCGQDRRDRHYGRRLQNNKFGSVVGRKCT